jgi:hypothetical protein
VGVIAGFFAPCSHPQVPSHLQLLLESLPPDTADMNDTAVEVHSNRNRLPVPGILYNTNTLESFQALDRQQLMSEATQQVYSLECLVFFLFEGIHFLALSHLWPFYIIWTSSF